VVSDLSHRLLRNVLNHSARSALLGEIPETTKDFGVEIALWTQKTRQKAEESFNLKSAVELCKSVFHP